MAEKKVPTSVNLKQIRAVQDAVHAAARVGKFAPKPAPVKSASAASGMGKKPAKGANAVTRKVFKPKRGK